MPGREILRNATMVAPAVFDSRRRAIVFVFYTDRDRRFVQEMQDQSIVSLRAAVKSPFKGLKPKARLTCKGTRREARRSLTNCRHGWKCAIPDLPAL